MKKIKVLQFPVANTKGGVTRYALENWRFIDKSRFAFDFATLSPVFSPEEELRRQGCEVFHLKKYAEDDEKSFRREFAEILQKGNYDVVHLHTPYWKSLNAEYVAKEAGVKRIIVHAHNTQVGGMDAKAPSAETLMRFAAVKNAFTEDLATDYWACSKMAGDFLFSGRIPPEKVRVMCNAIDLERFSFSEIARQKIRGDFEVTDKDFLIGNIAAFEYQKNQEFLLRVFRHIHEKNPQTKLLLVGKGPKEEEYRQFVAENNLTDSVIFAGYRNDVPALLSAMDLFVLPSRFEGLAIVLVDAQAGSLYCLASNTTPRESCLTGRIEYLPLEEKLWQNKIMHFTLNPPGKKDCRKEIAAAGYDIRQAIKKVEAGYAGELNDGTSLCLDR